MEQSDGNQKSTYSLVSLMTGEPNEISLPFLYYVMQIGGGYKTHSDTENAAQHATVFGGTQQISKKTVELLKKTNGRFEVMLHTDVISIAQKPSNVEVRAIQTQDPNLTPILGRFL